MRSCGTTKVEVLLVQELGQLLLELLHLHGVLRRPTERCRSLERFGELHLAPLEQLLAEWEMGGEWGRIRDERREAGWAGIRIETRVIHLLRIRVSVYL